MHRWSHPTGIRYYRNEYGDLMPLSEVHYELFRDGPYYVGVKVNYNFNLHSMFDSEGKLVLVRVDNHQNVPMTREIQRKYNLY